jgi:hypothetical protein
LLLIKSRFVFPIVNVNRLKASFSFSLLLKSVPCIQLIIKSFSYCSSQSCNIFLFVLDMFDKYSLLFQLFMTIFSFCSSQAWQVFYCSWYSWKFLIFEANHDTSFLLFQLSLASFLFVLGTLESVPFFQLIMTRFSFCSS